MANADKEYEMEIQKRAWDAQMSNRQSRSRSRSRNIMERARSFERQAENQRSRFNGSPSPKVLRSPSLGAFKQNKSDSYWQHTLEESQSRPASRTDHESRRWASIGKLDVSNWEQKIKGQNKPKIEHTSNESYHQSNKSIYPPSYDQMSAKEKSNLEKEMIIEQWVRQQSSEKKVTNGVYAVEAQNVIYVLCVVVEIMKSIYDLMLLIFKDFLL